MHDLTELTRLEAAAQIFPDRIEQLVVPPRRSQATRLCRIEHQVSFFRIDRERLLDAERARRRSAPQASGPYAYGAAS